MLWLREPLFLDAVGAAVYPVWILCPDWPGEGDSLKGKSCHISADDKHRPLLGHFYKGLAPTRASLESLGFAFKIT